MAERKKKIVVLGGGFGGVECVQQLESRFSSRSDVEIVLVSEDNFLLFTPMLPQVVSGMIETRHIIMPVRSICRRSLFYEARVKNIDPHGKIITLWGTSEKRSIMLKYDFLVLALGSQTNFFGLRDVEHRAYTMKTLNDAVVLRNRVIDMLEQAENETDTVLRKSMLTFVVVGGGFAGVETAGELIDLLHDAEKYYPSIHKSDVRVVLLEALDGILPGFNEKLARFAQKKLNERGIDIHTNLAVTKFDGTEVVAKQLTKGIGGAAKTIRTKTLIWTAGVRPVDTIRDSMFKLDGGKVAVNDFLEVESFPGVFAIGDCALFVDPAKDRPHTPTAQLAVAQAKTVAHNLHALITNQKKMPFVYKAKGQMAIIGKRTGIATVFGSNISGFWAWFLWRNIWLFKIPRHEKRLRVLLDWTIDLLFDRDISRLKLVSKPEHTEPDEDL